MNIYTKRLIELRKEKGVSQNDIALLKCLNPQLCWGELSKTYRV